MKIYLTFDYELFFGENSGTIEKCMLQPTDDLLRLAEQQNVSFTFFVDAGYLSAAGKIPELSSEVEKVTDQLKEILRRGHDIQLHVHPHWESAEWKDGKWKMKTSGKYKLIDYSKETAAEIIKLYKSILEEIKGEKIHAFRAGGWCIQPFSHLKDAFIAEGIKIDSSVIPGFYLLSNDYNVNFYYAPLRSKYRFENDVCIEKVNGSFIEYPIMSYRYSPLFYWSLYLRGKLSPSKHKMIGDGTFISHGRKKWAQLLSYTNMHISTDGYYAKKLEYGLEKAMNLEFEEMVVIGHPKGNTLYSLRKLEAFISKHCNEHQFVSFKSTE